MQSTLYGVTKRHSQKRVNSVFFFLEYIRHQNAKKKKLLSDLKSIKTKTLKHMNSTLYGEIEQNQKQKRAF